MASLVDWPMLLEFAKVSVGPALAFAGALIISNRAVRTFVAQRTFERRVNWYVRTHRAIVALPSICKHWSLAAQDGRVRDAEKFKEEALEANRRIARFGVEGVLFAGPRVIEAVKLLSRRLSPLFAQLSETPSSWDTAQEIEHACIAAGVPLSRELRDEMGSGQLGPPKRRWFTRRVANQPTPNAPAPLGATPPVTAAGPEHPVSPESRPDWMLAVLFQTWIENRNDFDRTILTLSAGGLGVWVTVLTAGKIAGPIEKGLAILSMLAFGSAVLIGILILLDNGKLLEQKIHPTAPQEVNKTEKGLGRWDFAMAILFGLGAGFLIALMFFLW